MLKIAVSEGSIPASSVAGLRELGQSVWILPEEEASRLRHLIEEFPPDIVILPAQPSLAGAAQAIRQGCPTVRILAATEAAAPVGTQPEWADLAVPREADPSLWFLAAMAVQPGSAVFRDPHGVRAALLAAVEAAHRALRTVGGEDGRNQHGLAGRLTRSFETLLRISLEQLERETHGDAGHSARVGALARRIGGAMGLSEAQTDALALAGLLHDLGMHLMAPPEALRRAGPLQDAEWEVVRTHPAASAAVVSPLPGSRTAAQAILEHHERLDGTGYPSGKRGDEVSLGARIVAVADSYEAMTHPRPHRPAMSPDRALEVLKTEAGSGRLDPQVCMVLDSVVAARGGRSEETEGR